MVYANITNKILFKLIKKNLYQLDIQIQDCLGIEKKCNYKILIYIFGGVIFDGINPVL